MIKYRKRTPNHKELLNLFNNLLDAILTDKTESESQEDKYENENAKKTKNNKKKLPIPNKMRMKTYCQNIWKMLVINCLENTVTVKILTVL